MNLLLRWFPILVLAVSQLQVIKGTAAAAPLNLPSVLPGRGLAHHDFFYAGEAKEERMFIVREGEIVWSYTHPGRGEISDAILLPNGNILFAHQYGITEISADKQVVWNLDAPPNTEIHTAQPFATNSVWFVQNGDPAKFMVVNRTSGKTEREFVLPVKNPQGIHGQFRHARMTDAGTLLVAHMDLGRAVEYDLEGTPLWSAEVPGIWSATPLANGNVLAVSNRGFVRELNRQREIVWEWTPADAPEYGFSSLQLAVRLPNGNTLINDWFNEWSGTVDRANPPVQAIEVTPDKQVVWALRSWNPPADLGPATTIQILDKTFIDYFLPMPIESSLVSDVWGAPGVLPRDPRNGLEDETMKQWDYWDGQILKGPEGKYHIFASRWDQAHGHRGWGRSLAVHAVSDKVTGPYVDQGLCWPDNQGGKGHNVTALVLPDGRYAVVVSETRPGDVFVSKSLDGPWEHLGSIQVADNEYSKLGRMSNVSLMVRPDGDYMIVPRSGAVLISKEGVLGPYVVQGPSVYATVPEMSQMRTLEDPVIWHSGGLYHIVVNDWNPRKAYHLTSVDGIKNWTFRGLAYDPTTDFLRYTDGTLNHWYKLERPGVVLENGHVTAVSLAVLDVPKNEEKGNDRHGSKIIVVPFDGAALDHDLQNLARAAVSKE